MSPAAFLENPIRWLQAISRYKGTTSGGPNFSYDLCIRKITAEQRESLDLSSWNIAFNGAEPIRAETLERFALTFAPQGFRREAFYPCYGLAEATLMVSGSQKDAPPVIKSFQSRSLENNRVVEATSNNQQSTRPLVGCGHNLFDQRVLVVNPETLIECQPDEVGEIWVCGASVAKGYWNRPEETERVFKVSLAGRGEGVFLRTGDLGFMQNEELFVTGRLKDMIILRGFNHYPEDIELTVEKSHKSLRPGCGAAFSIDYEGEERLVIVQEVGPKQFDLDLLIENICESVTERHELQVYAVSLIKPGTIPKTSSGKIQRHACKIGFNENGLATIKEWRRDVAQDASEDEAPAPAAPIAPQSVEVVQSWLVSKFATKLGVDPSEIDVHEPIARLGLDSLMAIELKHQIEAGLGAIVPIAALLESSNIAELAQRTFDYLTGVFRSSEPAFAPSGDSVMECELSHGQEALWFIHQLSPESSAYNIAAALRILSDLDVASLRRALQSLVRRHASLRTTFSNSSGKPIQLIHPDMEISLTEMDASDWDEELLDEQLFKEAYRPLDLEEGPLLRLILFSPLGRERILLLAVHHIVVDFWSLAVMVHELGILYMAEKTAGPAALVPVHAQYTDFVKWEESLLASQKGEMLWQYWQEQLSGELPVLDLPTDHSRKPFQSYHGASEHLAISQELTEKLKSLAGHQGATLYMILLAAFDFLLHRYTSQEDVIVGSPTSGRSRVSMREVVGYFANPVVLRADLSGDPSFNEFLLRIRKTVLSAFQHQDFPFGLLVERLQPVRDPSRSPIFQIAFVLQKAHLLDDEGLTAFALGESGARIQLGDLLLESIALKKRMTPFDITLTMCEVKGGMASSFEYDTDLFEANTIRRMAGHFETLLNGIVAAPDHQISFLPILTQQEQQQLLIWSNHDRTDYLTTDCLHRVFEQCVGRQPEAIAITFEGEQWSYGELNRRANQLAHHLISLGIGPEGLVGMYLERSLEMVVGILGILKAGGGYVPLDPAHASARVAFILEDTKTPVVLTQRSLIEDINGYQGLFICLDTDWGVISNNSHANPDVDVAAENIAYVIYTSGSTGKPKGVLVSHSNVARLFYATDHLFNFSDADVWTLFHSYGFDFSVWEIWGSLLYGGRLVVVPYWMSRSPDDYYEMLLAEQVTVLNQTPSAFRQLMQADEKANSMQGMGLREVIFGGEALEMSSLQGWVNRHGDEGVRLVNMYGITETTVHVTYRRVRERDVRGEAGSGIGRAISDLRVEILDRRKRQVGVGVAGEMYVGGGGVTRGYMGREEQTAERYIPDEYSGEEGARLYRTGDVGRWREDGEIEYLGRIDHQIKIHGYRIELGEIEAALLKQHGVKEAVVVAREDQSQDKRLAAYIVAEDQAELLVSEVRRGLRSLLPDYMVPSAIVKLDKMPVTANGKVDRRALPEPDQSRPDLDGQYAAARTDVEHRLCGIWCDVLRLDKVGINDNFFELGGDSILSVQVVARCNQAGLALTPKQIFQHQTICELATVVGTSQPLEAEQGAVTGYVPLTPIQRWFLWQEITDPHHFNQAVMLRVAEPVEPALIEQAIAHLVSHHDALRLRLRRQAEGWVQQIATNDQPRVVTRIELSGDSQQQRRQIETTAQQAQESLDLEQGPIIRVIIYEQAEKAVRVLMVIHHLGRGRGQLESAH